MITSDYRSVSVKLNVRKPTSVGILVKEIKHLIKFVCIDVAMCELVHDVETKVRLCLLLLAQGNLFSEMLVTLRKHAHAINSFFHRCKNDNFQ